MINYAAQATLSTRIEEARIPWWHGEGRQGARMGINTGRSIVYSLKPEEWSLHYALSPDGTCFGGDGGSGARGISPPGTGKWIYLYRRRLDGTLAVERLVNLSYHDYVIEPNVRFTPDGRWLIFAANLRGALQVYAVEITRASGDAGR